MLYILYGIAALIILYVFYVWYNMRRYAHIPGTFQIAPLTFIPLPDFLSPYYGMDRVTSFGIAPLFDTIAKDGIVRITAGGTSRIYIKDPEVIKDMALKRPEMFPKPPVYDVLTLYGDNIVNSNDGIWKKHRVVADPAFAENQNAFLVNESYKSTKLLIERLESKRTSDNRLIIDPHVEMQDVTLDVIGKVAFGYDLGIFQPRKIDAPHQMSFEEALKLTMTLGLLVVGVMPKFLRMFFPKTVLAVKETESYMLELIDRRIGDQKTDRFDLLSLLVDSNLQQIQETSLSRRELVSDVFIFLIAGHETSATTLQWIMYELCIHPEIQQRAYEEVVRVIGDDKDRVLNLDDYDAMYYLRCIVQESLRLHPPVTEIPKTARQNTKIGKYNIPANTELYFAVHNVHHDEKLWKDAKIFNPDRFDTNSDSHQKRHPCALIPFNIGARKCIGFKFSEIETAIILARMLLNYEIVLPKDDPKMQRSKVLSGDIEVAHMVTQRPKNLNVELKLRATN